MRQYFYKGKYLIAGSVLLIAACGLGVRDSRLPAWAAPGGVTETTAPVQLQGKWTLNKNLSDDPQQLLRRAIEKLKKDRRSVLSVDSGERNPGSPRVRIPEESDPYREAAVWDPRLAALQANSVLIEQDASAVSFVFDDAAPVSYLINQATSADNNINLTFADWEGSQFVVEKNGPGGLILERWMLSPDTSQLYLAVYVEIKLPDFPLPAQPVLIGRMFDRGSN